MSALPRELSAVALVLMRQAIWPAAMLRRQLTTSISLGRHSFVKNGSSGL